MSKEEGEVEHPLLAEGPHPLDGTWILWFDGALQSGKRNAPNSWAKNMKRVAKFSTVEDFWGVVNNIPPPSKLPVGSTYHLFREGIMPMWEDMNNAQGGKWIYNEKRDTGVSNKSLDNMWLYTMLCLVGENFAEAEEICGSVCSLRQKHDRVAVWTKTAGDEDKYNPIGDTFRKALTEAIVEMGGKQMIERDFDYTPHDESLKKLGVGKRR